MDNKNRFEILQKALHRTLFNAYTCGNKEVCGALHDMPKDEKDRIVDKLFSSKEEAHPKAEAEEAPMEKDMRQPGMAVSEIHAQKQANAMASAGQVAQPKLPKLAKEENGLSKLQVFLQARHSGQVDGAPMAKDKVSEFKDKLDQIKGEKKSPILAWHASRMDKSAAHEKGVHPDLGQWGTGKPGQSMAGDKARAGEVESAKMMHAGKLAEIKAIKKPMLKGDLDDKETHEEKQSMRGVSQTDRVYEKGVHTPFASKDKSIMGHANRGHWAHGSKSGNKEQAIKQHHKVMGEMKAIKPALAKAAPTWTPSKPAAGAMHFNHPEHGTVSIQKQPSGFQVKHNGALAGIGGVKGQFSTAEQAGAHAKKYMSAVSSGAHAPNQIHNISSEALMHKAKVDHKMGESMRGAGIDSAGIEKMKRHARLGRQHGIEGVHTDPKDFSDDKKHAIHSSKMVSREMKSIKPKLVD